MAIDLGPPFIRSISAPPMGGRGLPHPFDIPAFAEGIDISFRSNVTFFIGENGSGKSTLLEGVASQMGFHLSGGNRHHNYQTEEHSSDFWRALHVGCTLKVKEGFFMRAESFFNFASYIDQLAEEDSRVLQNYGGRSLHEQSHGESFLSLFNNLYVSEKGVYILDEPEAALSPSRQMSFMAIIHQLEKAGKAQFLIATHSPILLAYPGAVILELDETGIHEVAYKETSHYRLTREFLDAPERFFRHLFAED